MSEFESHINYQYRTHDGDDWTSRDFKRHPVDRAEADTMLAELMVNAPLDDQYRVVETTIEIDRGDIVSPRSVNAFELVYRAYLAKRIQTTGAKLAKLDNDFITKLGQNKPEMVIHYLRDMLVVEKLAINVKNTPAFGTIIGKFKPYLIV